MAPGTELDTQKLPKTRQLPPYKVILHNDDVNTVDHVILSILRLTPLDENEAIEKTVEAHNEGQALLLVTNRERAELYCEQFQSVNITVTCEPDA
ncbi:MAG: ATP-dependent Clp protease adaptor ClpS [Phycisphaerales bacterium]|nr:ATP-dependent Clp protease adaptor ClpS [Phycisphaerales bacterium]